MDGETSSQDAELVNNLEAEALSERNPEEQIIDQENVDHLEKLIETELSSFEREVLDLYMTGMSYTEIAKVLNKDEKSTDNALQRTKIKLRKGLEK